MTKFIEMFTKDPLDMSSGGPRSLKASDNMIHARIVREKVEMDEYFDRPWALDEFISREDQYSPLSMKEAFALCQG